MDGPIGGWLEESQGVIGKKRITGFYKRITGVYRVKSTLLYSAEIETKNMLVLIF